MTPDTAWTCTTVSMSVEQWIDLNPNPVQRDTSQRLGRALRYLNPPNPVHACVVGAILPDGTTWKVDGHTRALGWATGKVPPPAVVQVQMWRVPDRDALIRLYRFFDSPEAVEKTQDFIAGAERALGLRFTSPLMCDRRYTTALRAAETCRTGRRFDDPILSAVAEWSTELRIVDRMNLPSRRFGAAYRTAMLLAARKHGDNPRLTEFWIAVANSAGVTKAAGTNSKGRAAFRRNAVAALMLAKISNATTYTVLLDSIGKVLSAVESWLANDWYSQGLKSTNPTTYLPTRPTGSKAPLPIKAKPPQVHL